MPTCSSWLLDAAATPEMLAFERQAAEAGRKRIAGVDEAGRGPIAGPIVAAAVVLAHPIDNVDDSKKLSEPVREKLFEVILAGEHLHAIASVEAEEIDRLGIQQANYLAMKKAAEAIRPKIDFLLVDGFAIAGCALPQERIVKGDQRSQSIAAASILAKVSRDRTMRELAERYPQYGFERHKGYGTRKHLEALQTHGPCPAHRRSFAPIASRNEPGVLFS